jgi:hypothetical protein
LGKNSANLDEEKDETYFSYFRAMEKWGTHLHFLSRFITGDEEEHNDVYIYKTLQYPPKSTPPTAN